MVGAVLFILVRIPFMQAMDAPLGREDSQKGAPREEGCHPEVIALAMAFAMPPSELVTKLRGVSSSARSTNAYITAVCTRAKFGQ